MRNVARFGLFALLAASVLAGPAFADDSDIPDNLQGTWAINGACNNTARTIDIIGNTLAIGTGAPAVVTYVPNDSPDGNDAIHFTDEGDVSNFEYIGSQDELAYHEEGYGMGRVVAYTRCGDGDQSQSTNGNTMNDNSGNDNSGSNQASTRPSLGEVKRCGWLTQLNPGDTNLIDGDGTWILQKDGDPGETVSGFENVPGYDYGQHVSTGNGLGYACACMDVRMNASGGGIGQIDSVQIEKLRQCKSDPTLSDPSTW